MLRPFLLLGSALCTCGAALAEQGVAFTAEHPDYGREPWLHLGGTSHFLGDLSPGTSLDAAHLSPTLFSRADSKTYFVADDARHGIELWELGRHGPALPKELIDGLQPIFPGPVVDFSGEGVFLARRSNSHLSRFTQIWTIDDSERRQIYDCTGARSGWINGPYRSGGRLLFLEFQELPHRHPGGADLYDWMALSYDGASLQRLADGRTRLLPTQQAAAVFEGALYTILSGATHPALIRIDETGAALAAEPAAADALIPAGGWLYGLSSRGRDDWRYDGTDLVPLEGSVMEWDDQSWVASMDRELQAAAQGDDIVAVASRRFFRISDGVSALAAEYESVTFEERLKSIDGSLYCYGRIDGDPDFRGVVRLDPAGPASVAAFERVEEGRGEFDFAVDGDTVMYGSGEDLVVQSPRETTRYPILNPYAVAEPPRDGAPGDALSYQGWLYFPARSAAEGRRVIWRTNGHTVEATSMLPDSFREFAGRLYWLDDSETLTKVMTFDGIETREFTGGMESAPWSRVTGLQVVGGYLLVEERHKTLWVFDGTATTLGGTFDRIHIRDVVFRGAHYFPARDEKDGEIGHELWRFRDGAFELAADLAPGGESSSPGHGVVFEDKLYFAADTFDREGTPSGRELWVYDGTEATLVADLVPGEASSSPAQFMVVGSRLFFTAETEEHGRELWVVENGAARMVADLNPGPESSYVDDLTPFRETLLFSAFTADHGYELRSCADGLTVELVADLWPGPASSQPELELTTAGGCYYRARIPAEGTRLHFFDGSEIHSAPEERATPFDPEYLGTHAGTHYFGATGEAGRELYRVHGRAALELVRDVNPGRASGNPQLLAAIDDTLVLAADSKHWGRELAILPAIPESPHPDRCEVRWFDLLPGIEELYPRNNTIVREFVGLPDALYLLSTDNRVFRSDGHQTEEVFIAPLSGQLERVISLFRLGDELFLTLRSSDSAMPYQLLEVTGVAAQAVPGGETLGVRDDAEFHRLGDRWVFWGRDTTRPYSEPWVLSRGAVRPLVTDAPPYNPRLFARAGDRLYFRSSVPNSDDYRLFRTDGVNLEEIDLGSGGERARYLTHLTGSGDNLYVLIPNRPGPNLLVITPDGLQVPSSQPATLVVPLSFVALDGDLYLIARPGSAEQRRLYHITPAQMSEVPVTNPGGLTAADGRIYFAALDGSGRTQLYRHSDVGLTQVPNTFFSPWEINPSDLQWINGRLYLNATDVTRGAPFEAAYQFTPPATFRQLHSGEADWFLGVDDAVVLANEQYPLGLPKLVLADGTTVETDVELSHYEGDWRLANDRAVTTGTTPDTGTELFVFDGTDLSLLADVLPGPQSARPLGVTVVDLDVPALRHPFERWLEDQGQPAGSSPEDWPKLQDRFGAPLLLKYALGLNADQRLQPPKVRSPAENSISVELSIPEDAVPGVTLILETNRTLLDCDWEPLATRGPSGLWIQELGRVSFELQGKRQAVTITVPRESDAGRYFRLRAVAAP